MNKDRQIRRLEELLAETSGYEHTLQRLTSVSLGNLPEWTGGEVWRNDAGDRVSVYDGSVTIRVQPSSYTSTGVMIPVGTGDNPGNVLTIRFNNKILAKAAALMLADVFRLARL